MTFTIVTPMRKFFITVMFLALIICAVITACILMYQRINATVGDLGRFDAEIASRHKEQQQTGLLAALLNNHRADFNRVRSLSVSKTNPVSFLKDFEALALQTHTTIAITLDSGDTASDITKFQFAIEGTEQNVAAMLTLIEHAPYELTIDGLSIQKTSNEQGGVSVSISGPGAGALPPRMHLVINLHVKASP